MTRRRETRPGVFHRDVTDLPNGTRISLVSCAEAVQVIVTRPGRPTPVLIPRKTLRDGYALYFKAVRHYA